jgi:hypothetical protein
VWPWVAAIYSAVFVALWVVTMRPGYVTTDTSAFASLASCWGKCVRWNKWQGTSAANALSAGEYVSVQPRVHTFQFVRNVLFWVFVLGLKVRNPPAPLLRSFRCVLLISRRVGLRR